MNSIYHLIESLLSNCVIPLACFVFLNGVLHYFLIRKLVVLIYRFDKEAWCKLGKPGTMMFKGDHDNRFLPRNMAFHSLYQSVQMKEARKQFSRAEYRTVLRNKKPQGFNLKPS
jgi:hypothetical protein